MRMAREARGVSLRDVATRTKISAGTLEALERNDYARLPGGIFGRAFVRAYALEIGVDPDEAVSAFQTRLEASEREAAERGAVRTPISEDDREFLAKQRRAMRLLRVVLALLVVVLIAGVVWFVRGR